MTSCTYCGAWPYGEDCSCYEPCVCGLDSGDCGGDCPEREEYGRLMWEVVREVVAERQATDAATEMAVGG